MSDQRKSQTLLITVVAGAISSVAFGVSIFAMGILWLIPSVRPAPPNIPARPQRDKSRRRSAPPILQHSHRKLTAPVVENPPAPQQISPRRVYFLDSQIRPSNHRRYSDLTQLSTVQSDDIPVSSNTLLSVQVDIEVSPHSSSSTLVHVPPQVTQLETCQESIESDSSSRPGSSSSSTRPALSLTTQLPNKIKGGWVSKKSSNYQAAGDSGGETTHSDDATPSSSKSARRSSLGFNPSWLTKARRATIDLSSPQTASPTTPKFSLPSETEPNNINSPCPPSSSILPYFSRTPSLNSRRRTSAPVRAPPPRTQPYAYPYFAAPPISVDESRPSLTSSEESINDKLATPKDNRISEEYRLADERRKKNAEAQSSLGYGRKPAQRRAVSEMVLAVS